MGMARIILGEIFLAILVIGLVYAAVSPTLQPTILPRLPIPWFAQGNRVVDRYSLIKGTNISESVYFVNLNVTVNFGGISLTFSNTTDMVFDASFERAANASQLEVSYSAVSSGVMQANFYGDNGGLNLTLGKNCQCGGSLFSKLGGVLIDLGKYSNVSELEVLIEYVGGAVVNVGDDASFERLSLIIPVGGLQLNVDADRLSRSGVIEPLIHIGAFSIGVNVNTEQVGVGLDATVDTGRLTVNHPDFTGEVSATHCSVKTPGYSDATKNLGIKANVGLGGGTLHSLQPIPGLRL